MQSDLSEPFQSIEQPRTTSEHFVPITYEVIEQIDRASVEMQSCRKDALSKEAWRRREQIERIEQHYQSHYNAIEERCDRLVSLE